MFPIQESDGKSGDKSLFLLRTESNLGGERNSGGKAGLYRKAHLEDTRDGEARVKSVARTAMRGLPLKDLPN